MGGMGYWYSEDVQDVKRDEEERDGDSDDDGAGPVTSARNGWF